MDSSNCPVFFLTLRVSRPKLSIDEESWEWVHREFAKGRDGGKRILAGLGWLLAEDDFKVITSPTASAQIHIPWLA